MVLIDDFGWWNAGWHNNGTSHTPFLDSLIPNSVVLDRYYTYKFVVVVVVVVQHVHFN